MSLKPKASWAIALLGVLLGGCGPKPQAGLMFYGQANPVLTAMAHASERPGLIWKQILPTGSMEPFLTGGDTVVIDTSLPFRKAVPGAVLLYLPSKEKLKYYPGLQEGMPVLHMLAAWSGDEAIMDGIANKHYEKGDAKLTEKEYLGTMIAGYTNRERP